MQAIDYTNKPVQIDSIEVIICNDSGKAIYAGIQSNELNGKWINIGRVDKLEKNRIITNVQPTSEWHADHNKRISFFMRSGIPATIFLATQPLLSRPDYKSSLYIFDQIDIDKYGQWRLSNIDYLGMPMQLKSGFRQVGFQDGTNREDIFRKLKDITSPFNKYKIPICCDHVYRYYSPAKKNPDNIWRESIGYGLSRLSENANTYEYPWDDGKGISFLRFGESTEDSIRMIETAIELDKEKRKEIITRKFIIRNINTYNAIQGTLFPEEIDIRPRRVDNSDITIFSGALLSAAINRGVLYDIEFWAPKKCKSDEGLEQECYYQATEGNHGKYNEYAKVLHDFSLNGKCYGFCYDNIFNQGQYLEVQDGRVTITILPFN